MIIIRLQTTCTPIIWKIKKNYVKKIIFGKTIFHLRDSDICGQLEVMPVKEWIRCYISRSIDNNKVWNIIE